MPEPREPLGGGVTLTSRGDSGGGSTTPMPRRDEHAADNLSSRLVYAAAKFPKKEYPITDPRNPNWRPTAAPSAAETAAIDKKKGYKTDAEILLEDLKKKGINVPSTAPKTQLKIEPKPKPRFGEDMLRRGRGRGDRFGTESIFTGILSNQYQDWLGRQIDRALAQRRGPGRRGALALKKLLGYGGALTNRRGAKAAPIPGRLSVPPMPKALSRDAVTRAMASRSAKDLAASTKALNRSKSNSMPGQTVLSPASASGSRARAGTRAQAGTRKTAYQKAVEQLLFQQKNPFAIVTQKPVKGLGKAKILTAKQMGARGFTPKQGGLTRSNIPGVGSATPTQVGTQSQVGMQTKSKKCECEKPKKKEPRNICKNPIIKVVRDLESMTITRKLECPRSKSKQVSPPVAPRPTSSRGARSSFPGAAKPSPSASPVLPPGPSSPSTPAGT